MLCVSECVSVMRGGGRITGGGSRNERGWLSGKPGHLGAVRVELGSDHSQASALAVSIVMCEGSSLI